MAKHYTNHVASGASACRGRISRFGGRVLKRPEAGALGGAIPGPPGGFL